VSANRSDVSAALGAFIVEEVLLRDEPLKEDEDLFDAGFDSMSLSRVLVFVEEKFGVTIPDTEVVLEEVSTLNKLATFVADWIDGKAK
jgi:D-alanine--poly(phosphoribitol) ligase subunit 2